MKARANMSMAKLDFLNQNEPLFLIPYDRERGIASRPQRQMAALGGNFDVTGIKVAATDDDQIFDPARNI